MFELYKETMKLNKTLAIAALVAGSILAGTAIAQDAAKPGAGGAAGAPGGKRGGVTNAIERIAKALELTDAQKPKVKAVLEERMKKMRALREDTALSQEERTAKSKAIREAATAEMKAILTAEQFTKYEAMHKGRGQGGQPGQGGGRGGRGGRAPGGAAGSAPGAPGTDAKK
jgi:periplasmic protein CpxP/Spy